MPMKVTNPLTSGGDAYAQPFVGAYGDHTAPVSVVVANLTDDEVDANGFLKPGVLLNKSGALVTTGVAYGAVVGPTKVAASNAAGDMTAAGTVTVIVATHCQLNRDVVEDILGRALTAAEIAGVPAGHSVTLVE